MTIEKQDLHFQIRNHSVYCWLGEGMTAWEVVQLMRRCQPAEKAGEWVSAK